jgi:hypothetical protein
VELSDVSKAIHDDAPLANKRRLLVGLSMVLIGIFITEAKIAEANTLFFKITFANMNGILALLLVSVGFVLFRYYSYASMYQQAIEKIWTDKLLRLDFFYQVGEHTDEEAGYLVELAPEFSGYNDEEFRHDKYSSFTSSINLNLFFNAQIQYDLYTQDGHMNQEIVYVFSFKRFKKSITALRLIFQTWWESQIKHRESMDIYAPYFIALIAIYITVYPILAKLLT